MRPFMVLILLLPGCGLTSYSSDRDSILREIRNAEIGPYYAEVSETATPGPAPKELEETIQKDGLTVKEAVRYALARNPELVSALSHWEMRLQRVPQVSSFDDPQFMYEEYIKPTETRAGPKERKFTISQKIPWPGKLRLKGEMALEGARMAELEYRFKLLRLIEKVEHAYADLALVHRLIEINEELKRIMKGFEKLARKKLEASRGTQPDVLRAQIQYIHLEHHGIVLERDRKVALEKLNALLNRPSRAPIGSPDMPSRPQMETTLEVLLKRAEANCPLIRKAEHALKKALAQRSLASLAYIPDFTIAARYEQVKGGTNPGFGDDGEDIFTVTFGFNLPVQGGRRSGATAEAEGAIRMARAELLQVRRDIQRDTVVAYERLVELRHEAHLLHDTLLPQTKHHLRAAQKAYEVGDLDFLSLMEAEKNIEGIHRDYARVIVQYQQALSTIRRVVGGRLK